MTIRKILIVATLSSIFSFSALANGGVENCKAKIFHAADTIQSIANTVPNKAFGKFTQNGNMLALGFAVTGIGGGDPVAGARALFEMAKPVLNKYEAQIFKAAGACVGQCDDVSSLQKRCDDVQSLANLLHNLDFNKAYEIAQAISSYRGTNGVKRSVQKEVDSYYRDRN